MHRERDKTVDFLKGIAILLVVIGHFNPVKQVGNFIYSFHMPLFFFLSGITFWYSFGKKLNRENSKKLISEVLMKRVFSLCLPYVSWSVIRFGFWGDSVSESFDRLWFLPTLFGITVIFTVVEWATILISQNGSELKIICMEVLFSVIFCSVVLLLMRFTDIKLFREILIYAGPFYMGFALKKYRFVQKLFDSQVVITLSLLIFCCLVPYYSAYDKSIIVLAVRYITGICFTIVLYYSAKAYVYGANNRMLEIFELFGKNTLKVYIIHDFFRPFFQYNIVCSSFWDTLFKIFGALIVCLCCIVIAYILSQSNIIDFLLFGKKNNKLSEVRIL